MKNLIKILIFTLSFSAKGQNKSFYFYRYEQTGIKRLDIGESEKVVDKNRVRVLIIYSNTVENYMFIDSLLDLQAPGGVLNKDSFVVHVVELYKPEKSVEGGYCPPPSKLYFYGKEIVHSSYGGGVWIFLDPESTYWSSYRGKLRTWDIGKAPGQPELLSFKNSSKFFELVTKNSYTPAQLHKRISNLVDTLNSHRTAAEAFKKELSFYKALELGVVLNHTSYGLRNLPSSIQGSFVASKVNSQRIAFVVKRNQIELNPEKGLSLNSSMSIGLGCFQGRISQKAPTYKENLGWYIRENEPYERMVYMNGINDHLKLKTLNLGSSVSISLEPKGSRWEFELEGGLMLQKVTTARFNITSSQVSFGGLFPNINPEDTILSGTGDFISNALLNIANDRISTDPVFLSYTLGLKAAYYFSDSKACGFRFGLGWERVNMPFNVNSSKLFSSNDLGSYQSLWSRIGNQSLNAIQLNAGIFFKIR